MWRVIKGKEGLPSGIVRCATKAVDFVLCLVLGPLTLWTEPGVTQGGCRGARFQTNAGEVKPVLTEIATNVRPRRDASSSVYNTFEKKVYRVPLAPTELILLLGI